MSPSSEITHFPVIVGSEQYTTGDLGALNNLAEHLSVAKEVPQSPIIRIIGPGELAPPRKNTNEIVARLPEGEFSTPAVTYGVSRALLAEAYRKASRRVTLACGAVMAASSVAYLATESKAVGWVFMGGLAGLALNSRRKPVRVPQSAYDLPPPIQIDQI